MLLRFCLSCYKETSAGKTWVGSSDYCFGEEELCIVISVVGNTTGAVVGGEINEPELNGLGMWLATSKSRDYCGSDRKDKECTNGTCLLVIECLPVG